MKCTEHLTSLEENVHPKSLNFADVVLENEDLRRCIINAKEVIIGSGRSYKLFKLSH